MSCSRIVHCRRVLPAPGERYEGTTICRLVGFCFGQDAFAAFQATQDGGATTRVQQLPHVWLGRGAHVQLAARLKVEASRAEHRLTATPRGRGRMSTYAIYDSATRAAVRTGSATHCGRLPNKR